MTSPISTNSQLAEPLAEDSGYYIRGDKLLEKGNTGFQDYEVWTNQNYGNLLRLDGILQLTERDEFIYHENMVHIAALAHEAPKTALIIGGGDGGTLEELLKYKSLERVVMIELDRKVLDVADKYFTAVTNGAFKDPRLDLRVQDGLVYVQQDAPAAGDRFDLIILDLSDPVGPSAALYTEEFFGKIKAILTPGGGFALHLGPALFQPARVATLYQRLTRIFKTVAPYAVYIPFYGSLWSMAVASDSLTPAALSESEIENRIAQRSITDLQYINGATYRAVLAQPGYMNKILGAMITTQEVTA